MFSSSDLLLKLGRCDFMKLVHFSRLLPMSRVSEPPTPESHRSRLVLVGVHDCSFMLVLDESDRLSAELLKFMFSFSVGVCASEQELVSRLALLDLDLMLSSMSMTGRDSRLTVFSIPSWQSSIFGSLFSTIAVSSRVSSDSLSLSVIGSFLALAL